MSIKKNSLDRGNSLMTIIKRCATLVVAAVPLALACGVSPASADYKDDGPTRPDFTVNGVFDQAGYIVALLGYESAPVLNMDGPIKISVKGCSSGRVITAVFVGYPSSSVSKISTGTPTTFEFTPPANIEVGFNIIRVTCGETAKQVATVQDVIVDLRHSGSAGLRTELTVTFGSSGRGGIPTTGSDARSLLGVATASLLLGGAVVVGARRRFHVTAAS